MSSYYGGNRGRDSTIPWPAEENGDNNVWAWRASPDWSQSWNSNNNWGGGGASQAGSEGTWSNTRWDADKKDTNFYADKKDTNFSGDRGGWESSSGPQSWYSRRPASSAATNGSSAGNTSSGGASFFSGTSAWSNGWSASPGVGGEPKAFTAKSVQEPKDLPKALPAKAPSPKPLRVPRGEAPPLPSSQDVQEALAELASVSNSTEEKAQRFTAALRLCAALPSEATRALDLLDEMKDNHGLEPDASAYLAALGACETAGQPLERAWLLLDEMRKQGLDLDSPLPDEGPGLPQLRHDADAGFWEALESHARTWLARPAPRKALGAIARLGSLLRRRDQPIASDIEMAMQKQVVEPVVEALREAAPPGSAGADLLLAVPSLGSFTADVLSSLGMGTGTSGQNQPSWASEAAAELRRQAMLRQWASWNEPGGPGLLAWMAYDLSCTCGKASWDLSSDGESFGRSSQEVDDLLPALAQDARCRHAERRALLALTERLLQGFSTQGEVLQVKGVVMLYTPQAPDVASIYAARQFLQLFPWLRLCFAYDAGSSTSHVEIIGEKRSREEAETNGPSTNGKGKDGKGKTGDKGAGKGKVNSGATNGIVNGVNGTNGAVRATA